MAQLSQVPQIKNGKLDFSPTFQKVELHIRLFSNYITLFRSKDKIYEDMRQILQKLKDRLKLRENFILFLIQDFFISI